MSESSSREPEIKDGYCIHGIRGLGSIHAHGDARACAQPGPADRRLVTIGHFPLS